MRTVFEWIQTCVFTFGHLSPLFSVFRPYHWSKGTDTNSEVSLYTISSDFSPSAKAGHSPKTRPPRIIFGFFKKKMFGLGVAAKQTPCNKILEIF